MNKILTFCGIVLVVVAGLVIYGTRETEERQKLGGVAVGDEYLSTTTRNFIGVPIANFSLLKSNQGTLGRITITGSNTGIIRFWDATTTNINLRAPELASTTILLAEIPTGTVAGVYEFDTQLRFGLIYELVSGLAPTSTITFR